MMIMMIALVLSPSRQINHSDMKMLARQETMITVMMSREDIIKKSRFSFGLN